MQSLKLRLIQRIDPLLFATKRADYFEYLYAVLNSAAGSLTIRDLFLRDAKRHGLATVRGRLSAKWASLCELSGGDLYATWRAYFPLEEIILVRIAQSFGNQGLLECFGALARHLQLIQQAKQILWSTLAVAIAAIAIVFAVLLAVPWWTIPSLERAFVGIPSEYLGFWSSGLFSWAVFLRQWGWILPLLLLLVVILFLYSLPRFTGSLRPYLDKFFIWRLYRQVNAVRFLSLFTILMRPNMGVSQQLRPLLYNFQEGASPWFGGHIKNMIKNIDAGITGPEAFNTGLLDQEIYWYFADIAIACGLQNGLLKAQLRVQNHWLTGIARQAQTLRWACLLAGLATVLAIGLWHYAAIDDLRRAWMLFNSSDF